MKHVLVLLGRYKPQMSPNSICMDKIIKLLPEDEFDITCICYEDYLKSEDNRVKTYKVSRGVLHSALYKIENIKTVFGTLIKRFLIMCIKIKMIPCLLFWPWTDPIYTHKVNKLAQKLYSDNPFDMVIAVHMPLSSLIVGNQIKRKHPNTMFVAYFLDSLSGGRPIRLFSDKWNINRKLRWEKKLLDIADQIVVMEASRAHHEKYSAEQYYYSRFVFLDVPLLYKKSAICAGNLFDTSKINILFCGTANFPMRNMKNFVKVANVLSDTDVEFTIVGDTNCAEMFQSKNITYVPRIEHEKLCQYYESADILINFGVQTPSAISGKIFEYMSYGKPIISTYSIEDEACILSLKRYPLHLLIDERESVILQANKIVMFARANRQKRVEMREINELYYNNTPEAFVDIIFKLKNYC